MGKAWKKWSILVVAVVGLAPAAPAAAPLAGNWKVTVVSEGKEITLALVRVEDKGDKPAIQVLAPAAIKDARLEDVAVEARSLRFTLRVRGTPLHLIGYAPKGEEKSKKLLGSVHAGPGEVDPLILERTEQTSLAEKDAVKDSPGFDEFVRLQEVKDARKQQEGLKELAKKHVGEPVALAAAELLVDLAVSGGAAEKVRAAADSYLQEAARYGRELELHAAFAVARALLSAGRHAELALEYAQKAEKQLAPTDPLEQQAAVLKILARALAKAGKDGEARAVHARLAKLDNQLDEEFARNAIPFQPAAPPRRQRGSDRVVLLELFTGAQCPPCVAADIAFDAVLKTYKTSDVVLLQYHLHVPGPDPLTNADSVARSEYYGKAIEGTPTAFLDGRPTELLGGGAGDSQESYDALRKQLDERLQKNAGANLKLDVRRTGDKIELAAEVSDLDKPGDRVRLHFALVEEVVRYPGRNRQRLHHHVVRSFPGGVKGFALLEATASKKVAVDVADVKKTLRNYLDKSAKDQPFLDDERPLNLRHLKVVAFIQDDKSKEVLQAVQVDVPAGE